MISMSFLTRMVRLSFSMTCLSSLAAAPQVGSVIFFGADGMRPDFMERYAREGAMPTYERLLSTGARGANGMTQAFPPNTGVGWTTMATGAWPGRHGSMNNTFHVACCNNPFSATTSGFQSNAVDGVLIQAKTLLEAAEQAGKKVVAIEWPASRNFPIRGQAIDFRTFHSSRGIVGNYRRASDNTNLVAASGLDYDIVALRPATGWTNMPVSYSPPLEATVIIRDFGAPKYNLDAYLFDPTDDQTANYTNVLLTRSPGQGAQGKDGAQALATLTEGAWGEIRLPLLAAGALTGKTAGLYVKLEELSPDAARFRLYHTSLARVSGNDPAFVDFCSTNFPPPTAADFAPLQAGIVTEETYVEQGLFWRMAHHPILEHLLTNNRPDVVLAGFPVTDEFSHQFLALITTNAPVYDDANRDGVPDGRVAIREGFLRQAYSLADATLTLIQRHMPTNALVVAGSDHGFAPSWKSINAGKVLFDLGLQSAEQTANGRPIHATNDVAKATWAGGTAAVYLNLAGRDAPGSLSQAQFEDTRQKIKAAFENLTDTNGVKVIERVFLKEELANVQGGNSLHPTRSGDVTVVARPGYQFDAATRGLAVANAPFFGQHGYLPDTVNLVSNVNLHATFLISGPGVAAGKALEGVRAVDLEPTIAHALGLPPVAAVDGRVLHEAFAAAPSLPHGVAAGDTTASSAVLWTRSTALGALKFEWSAENAASTSAAQATVQVTDPQVPVKLMVTNLMPGTVYLYSVTDAAMNTARGRFKTAAASGLQAGLRFGISGDWRGDLAPFPAVANAASRPLDFFVALGDTIYADYPSPALTNLQARTLADFRVKHAEAYSERHGLNTLAALRQSTAFYAMIDDHEVINDFAGGAAPASDPRVDPTGAFVNETQLYRHGLQAFEEYYPLLAERYDTPGQARTHGKPKLYRARTFGADAALFLVDARSFRDRGLPAVESATNPAQVAAFLAQSFDINPATGQPLPRRTMLGGAQLADLKRDLLAAHQAGVTWKFVCVPEPIQNLGVLAASDRYEGYAAERTELLQFLHGQGIPNVVFVAADIHGTLVNNLTYSLGPGAPPIATGYWEITTGAVAFDAPFGPTVLNLSAGVDLGGATLLSTFLQSLGLPNLAAFNTLLTPAQKNAGLASLVDTQIKPLGYSPVGLEDSPAPVRLTQGGYAAVFSYGWTEFEIDPRTQALTVTTYGITPYTVADTGPALAQRVPEVVSQFTVAATGPRLEATRQAQQAQLRWPSWAVGYRLQSASEVGGAWSAVTAAVTSVGAQNEVTLPLGETRFFRLAR
jgi:phosphodiesterase/alkaline phosphatase D-like protein/predicted AlkP superfamily phosphohydrolase/phosphomutase